MAENRGTAPLLMSMINAEFGTTTEHEEEKTYFCVNCRGESLTKTEKDEEHEGHKVLKAYKSSGFYGYRENDIKELRSETLGVSKVRPYINNKENIYYQKSRINNNSVRKNKDEDGDKLCLGCGFVIGSKYWYCSLLCRLSPGQEADNVRAVEQDDAAVGNDLQTKKNKKKRKMTVYDSPDNQEEEQHQNLNNGEDQINPAAAPQNSENVRAVEQDDAVGNDLQTKKKKKKKQKKKRKMRVPDTSESNENQEQGDDDSVNNNNNGEDQNPAAAPQNSKPKRHRRKGTPHRSPFF